MKFFLTITVIIVNILITFPSPLMQCLLEIHVYIKNYVLSSLYKAFLDKMEKKNIEVVSKK